MHFWVLLLSLINCHAVIVIFCENNLYFQQALNLTHMNAIIVWFKQIAVQ